VQRLALSPETAHQLVHRADPRADESVLGLVRHQRELSVIDRQREGGA
jgi:hypothetical protein